MGWFGHYYGTFFRVILDYGYMIMKTRKITSKGLLGCMLNAATGIHSLTHEPAASFPQTENLRRTPMTNTLEARQNPQLPAKRPSNWAKYNNLTLPCLKWRPRCKIVLTSVPFRLLNYYEVASINLALCSSEQQRQMAASFLLMLR